MENKYVALLAIAIILVAIAVVAIIPSDSMTDDELNQLVSGKVSDLVAQQSLEYQDVINGLNAQITELEAEKIVEDEVISEELKISSGYELEDVNLAEGFSENLTDREVSKLYDSEVDFDDEDYDVEEIFEVNGEVLINGDDFGENAYLTFEEGDLVYRLAIDSELNLTKIDEDEVLTLSFLGSDLEISDWDVVKNEITFTKGEEQILKEGDSIIVNGKEVILSMVLDDSIYVTVDGIGEKIEVEDTEKVNGVEIKVSDVLYSGKSSSISLAILQIGDKVEEVIENGDEYSEDSIWAWQISNHSIGLVLSEDFNELDDRDDFNALDVDGKICLPNDYLCVEYKGLVEEDLEEYTFELDDGVVVIEGKFLAGINDYDELFINITNGSIYEDDDCTIPVIGPIFFGESNLTLTSDAVNISIGSEIVLSIGLDSILVNGENVTSEDNYRSAYGIVIENPEDAVEEKEFKITIPEEALVAKILVF